jgi:hypothetical protein
VLGTTPNNNRQLLQKSTQSQSSATVRRGGCPVFRDQGSITYAGHLSQQQAVALSLQPVQFIEGME